MSRARPGPHPSRPASRSQRLGVALAVLALTASPACFSDDPETTGPEEADVIVEMTGSLTFAPATVTIRVGETVRWDNVSSVPHTVTADPAEVADPDNVSLPAGALPFASPLISAGGSYARTFTVTGTYRYVCVPHEGAGMLGTVIVED